MQPFRLVRAVPSIGWPDASFFGTVLVLGVRHCCAERVVSSESVDAVSSRLPSNVQAARPSRGNREMFFKTRLLRPATRPSR